MLCNIDDMNNRSICIYSVLTNGSHIANNHLLIGEGYFRYRDFVMYKYTFT